MKYILITAAYNEEKYIQDAIESVINQTVTPVQWIIVSDASTDGTDRIAQHYSEKIPFLTFVRYVNPEQPESRLGRVSKRVVACVREGLKHVIHRDFEYIGIIDADVKFEKNLFERLLEKFSENENLGLGGAFIYNISGDKKWPYFTKTELVGGPLQLFRKECWDKMEGFYPGGHHDYYAVVSCKMHGWEARSYSDLEMLHCKNPVQSKANMFKVRFHLGQMDYVCGEIFPYVLARALSQMKSRPVIIGSLCRIAGYLFSVFVRTPKQVPVELADYLKKEQVRKLLPKFVGKRT